MRSTAAWFAAAVFAAAPAPSAAADTPRPAPDRRVGPGAGGAIVAPSGQLLRPEGRSVEFDARPVDVVVTRDGRFAYAKDNRGVVAIDAAAWTVLGRASFPGNSGGSMVGLALAPDGQTLYATDAGSTLAAFPVGVDGRLGAPRAIALPAPAVKGAAFPCGVAVSADGAAVYVCLSRSNTLAVVSAAAGTVEREIPVGVAPFGVALSPDGAVAYVTTWGGSAPGAGDLAADSSGTMVKVDARGVALAGGLSIVDLAAGKEVAFVETGRGAATVVVSADGSRVYVANSNDDTVSVVDPAAQRELREMPVKPVESLPFGSMPAGLALTPGGERLLVACTGNNAVAVLRTADGAIEGWLNTGWRPVAVAVVPSPRPLSSGATPPAAGSDLHLVVANARGVGSRAARAEDGAFNSHRHRGTLQHTLLPAGEALRRATERVLADSLVPQALEAQARDPGGGGVRGGGVATAAQPAAPQPVPAQVGGPSPIEHVIYIIKENRTYDQLFGDLAAGPNPKGRGKPELCIYGRDVTPNHHALAEEFVLLDNFYCNGVLSADGHAWATEGNVTTYLERSFGGFARSYTFGDDPLSYSASGFVWDHVLAAGRTFRNYGELVYSDESPDLDWPAVLADWRAKGGKVTWGQRMGLENLRRHTHPTYPGWNMDISEQIRADIFLEDLARFEKEGNLPSLLVVYLPQDHTMGVTPGGPTPRACMADNDLALGRIVEAVSRSRFWPKAAVFVVEDDPQDGWDHVDGHRSICLVASPWARRGAVVSNFASQASVIHTILRILGAAAPNQASASSPLMDFCFLAPGQAPDLRPYAVRTPAVAIDELTPPKEKAGACAAPLYDITARIDLTRPDAAEEDDLNRIHWHAARGCEPYPAPWAGAHGAGLPAVGLRHDPRGGVTPLP